MKAVPSCERRGEEMERGNKWGKEREGMLGSAETEGERERGGEGRGLKQKWQHAVIRVGLKACQDLRLLVQYSVCHCCFSESLVESHENSD